MVQRVRQGRDHPLRSVNGVNKAVAIGQDHHRRTTGAPSQLPSGDGPLIAVTAANEVCIFMSGTCQIVALTILACDERSEVDDVADQGVPRGKQARHWHRPVVVVGVSVEGIAQQPEIIRAARVDVAPVKIRHDRPEDTGSDQNDRGNGHEIRQTDTPSPAKLLNVGLVGHRDLGRRPPLVLIDPRDRGIDQRVVSILDWVIINELEQAQQRLHPALIVQRQRFQGAGVEPAINEGVKQPLVLW